MKKVLAALIASILITSDAGSEPLKNVYLELDRKGLFSAQGPMFNQAQREQASPSCNIQDIFSYNDMTGNISQLRTLRFNEQYHAPAAGIFNVFPSTELPNFSAYLNIVDDPFGCVCPARIYDALNRSGNIDELPRFDFSNLVVAELLARGVFDFPEAPTTPDYQPFIPSYNSRKRTATFLISKLQSLISVQQESQSRRSSPSGSGGSLPSPWTFLGVEGDAIMGVHGRNDFFLGEGNFVLVRHDLPVPTMYAITGFPGSESHEELDQDIAIKVFGDTWPDLESALFGRDEKAFANAFVEVPFIEILSMDRTQKSVDSASSWCIVGFEEYKAPPLIGPDK